MNQEFLQRESRFLLTLVLFTVLLFGIHYYILFHFASQLVLTLPLYTIYAFHFITVLLIYTFVNYKISKGTKEIFTLFMVCTLIKMILAIIFLLPLFLKPTENKTVEAVNFFIPYFLFLAFEIVSITSFLKKK